MIFIAMTMIYYGLILFKLQKNLKITDETTTSDGNDIQFYHSIIKLDHGMLVAYGILFILFNIAYFISYAF